MSNSPMCMAMIRLACLARFSQTFTTAAADALATRWCRKCGLAFVSALCIAGSPVLGGTDVPHYRIHLTLNPDAGTIAGTAEISVADGKGFELLLNGALDAKSVRIDGVAASHSTDTQSIRRWAIPPGSHTVRVRWDGRLPPIPEGVTHSDTVASRMAHVDPRGSYLPPSAFWYPVIMRDGTRVLHGYRVDVDLPAAHHAIIPGDISGEHVDGDRRHASFSFSNPAEGISLITGPYHVDEIVRTSIDGRSLRLRTYFHPELESLAGDYLDSTAAYIERYERWIGPYPFTSFAVVSSPTPTGFGLPALTYLGIEVLRLPFIRHTSLGHEVLHNWWGNGVYPDYESGNWSEGLTTFMADYTYALDQGEDRAREMRLGWLRDLSAVPETSAMALSGFTTRHHGAAQAVGYGKAAMVFAMLRERIGTDTFDRSVRRFWNAHRFRVASWADLRLAFEAESGQSLSDYFGQWLSRKDLPSVDIDTAQHTNDGLTVTLRQRSPPWVLDVPLGITTTTGSDTVTVRLTEPRQSFNLEPAGVPVEVALDPESRMLRRLEPQEAPPILRELQLDHATRLVLPGPESLAESARSLASAILEGRFATQADHQGTAQETAPLLVIGDHAHVGTWLKSMRLPAPPAEVAGRGELRMWTLRLESGVAVALVSAEDARAIASATRRLPHYGRQSWLMVADGQVADRGTWPALTPRVRVGAPE